MFSDTAPAELQPTRHAVTSNLLSFGPLKTMVNMMHQIRAMAVACSWMAALALISACGDGGERQVIGEVNMFEDSVLVAMYDAADRRNAAALLPYATHPTAAYRRGFARLVGSMPDSVLLDPLARLLSDPIPYVRLEAAWAIGQYRDTLPLEPLEKAMRKATIPEVKAELLEAIGKCAHPRAMAFLMRHEPNTPVEEGGKIWGIYRATLRGMLEEKHLRVVVAHLRSREADTRLGAAHVLSRQSQYRLDAFRDDIQEVAKGDPNAEVRQAAVKAMARTEVSNDFFVEISASDPDPTVRAAAISALRHPFQPSVEAAIADALEDGEIWVAMSAAARLDLVEDTALVRNLRSVAITSRVPEVRAEILSATFSRTPPQAHSRAWQLYSDLWAAHPSPAHRAVLMQGLGGSVWAYDTLVTHLHTKGPVATAAARALVQLARQHGALREQVAALALHTVQTGDTGPATVFAEAAAEPFFKAYLQPHAAAFRDAALRFEGGGQTETHQALMAAHAYLGGGPVGKNGRAAPAAELHHPIDWDLVKRLPRKLVARLHTGGQAMEWVLLVEDAPGSVSHLVRLAQEGFYDGLDFHRIVPGFVSQGGCPLGDGYGSVPYTIRSEFAALRYGMGVVGLASAGPDTEGCQFFITHTSAPHLDGRYTIVGSMTSGHELLTTIGSGAVIDSLRIDFRR